MIDLHSHTDQSDGTLTPAELVAEAKRAGLTALAITDHDTFAGYDAAVPLAASSGLELICGIEVSTKYLGLSVHLLAYFPNRLPSDEFRSWLLFLQEMRRDRNRRLITRLQELGIDITLAEVEKYGRTLTARPHFARVLMDKGYVKSLQEAFDLYLDESAKAWVFRQDVAMEEALERIAASGGISSLAHPIRVANNNWSKIEAAVADLKPKGLRAIEVFHTDHRPEDISFYQSLATRYGLAVTGGSDFHGANKPGITLGKLEVPDSLLQQLKTLR